jgi:SAM-dependent methyltransferase
MSPSDLDRLRWALYRHCVQNPPATLAMLDAITRDDRARVPRTLHEDFAGSAAIAHAWCANAPPAARTNPRAPHPRRAVAIDLDPVALACAPAPRARAKASTVRTLVADLRNLPRHATAPKADIIYAGNFGVCELHDRGELLAYLKGVRARLARKGSYVCDLYTGPGALRTSATAVLHPALTRDQPARAPKVIPAHARVRYTWRQRDVDLLSGIVSTSIDFALLSPRGKIVRDLPDAFAYRWRLWSIPELRDAFAQAGFSRCDVYDTTPDAMDHEGAAYAAARDSLRTRTSAVVYVVGRA